MSTVLCFHDVQCLEPSCSNHGTCHQGECTCESPWFGNSCALLNCSLTECSDHGNCTDGMIANSWGLYCPVAHMWPQLVPRQVVECLAGVWPS